MHNISSVVFFHDLYTVDTLIFCPFDVQVEEIWPSSDSSDNDTGTDSGECTDKNQPIWQLVYFLVLWQSLYRISNAALTALLKFLSLFFRIFQPYVVQSRERVNTTVERR